MTEQTVYQTTLPDGTSIKRRRQLQRDNSIVEIIEEEGPAMQKTVHTQEHEEVLPDGTVHRTHRSHSQKVKHFRKRIHSLDVEDEDKIFEEEIKLPGTKRQDTVETFEEPVRCEVKVEKVEEQLPSGEMKKKKVIHNRMVHKIRTRHQSQEEGGGSVEEEYEIDEIIPGTETAFVESDRESTPESVESTPSSDLEAETLDKDFSEESRRDDGQAQPGKGEVEYSVLKPDGTVVTHHPQNVGEVGYSDIVVEEGPPHEMRDVQTLEERLPDGTIHKSQMVHSHVVKHVLTHMESEKGDQPLFEADVEVPGTEKEDLIEIFEEPVHAESQVEEVDESLPSGENVKRHIHHSRLVQHIKTKHKSIDSEGGQFEEEYDLEEVVPGTECAFFEEPVVLEADKISTDYNVKKEILGDGRLVTQRVVSSEEVRTVRSRSGSLEQETDQLSLTEEEVSPSPQRQPSPGQEVDQSYRPSHGGYFGPEDVDYQRRLIQSGHVEQTYSASDGQYRETADQSVETFEKPTPSPHTIVLAPGMELEEEEGK